MYRSSLVCGAVAIAICSTGAHAQVYEFSLPAQKLERSLQALGAQARAQIVFSPDMVSGKSAPAVRGELTVEGALAKILAGSGLRFRSAGTGYVIVPDRKLPPAPTGTKRVSSLSQSPPPDAGAFEIVVTAQKRTENIQDVPIAIIAASQEQLRSSGVESLQQLPALAPGLNVRTTVGSFQPSIRGIGTPSFVVENPVALYIDGVYIPQQREGLRDLNDAAQIAVLKGPQGTLFGRNTTGGVIQITTRQPEFEFGGEFGGSIDNYATMRGDFYLTGGLSNNIASSVSGSFSAQGNGWGDSLTTGRDTYKLYHQGAIRWKTLLEMSDTSKLTLIADYMDRSDSGSVYQPYPGTSYSLPGFGPISSRYDTYAVTATYNKFKGGGLSAQLDQELGFAKLIAIASYRSGRAATLFDSYSAAFPYLTVSIPETSNNNYTGELQLISNDSSNFNWVVGAFYYHNKLGVDNLTRAFSGPPAPVARVAITAEETAESFAPFAQATWELSPSMRLTGGVRWTYERRELVNASVTTVLKSGSASTVPLSGAATVREPTFRISLDRRLSGNILAYASYNTGIKSGGFNVINPANPPYLPEKLHAYEVGLKIDGDDADLNVSAFYYDYSNIQVTQNIGGTSSITNGAKAKIYGLDADFNWKPARGLSLTGGMELLHAEFTSYPDAIFSTPLRAGGAVVFTDDASGKRLPLAQKFVATLAANYEIPAGENVVKLNATANYNGDYYFESDNFLRQPAYVMLNTSASLKLQQGVEISIWVRNLFDEAIIAQAATSAPGYVVTYGSAPRTFGAGFRYRF